MCHPEKVSFLRSYIHFISSREISWIRKPTVAKLNQKANNENVVNLLHFPRLLFKITFHQTSCISSQLCFIFHWKNRHCQSGTPSSFHYQVDPVLWSAHIFSTFFLIIPMKSPYFYLRQVLICTLQPILSHLLKDFD